MNVWGSISNISTGLVRIFYCHQEKLNRGITGKEKFGLLYSTANIEHITSTLATVRLVALAMTSIPRAHLLEAWDVCFPAVLYLWKTTYFKFCTKYGAKVLIALKILLPQLINWQGFSLSLRNGKTKFLSGRNISTGSYDTPNWETFSFYLVFLCMMI